MDTSSVNALVKRVLGYFSLRSYLIPQADAEQSVREGVSFSGVNMLMLIIAIFIASLGLNTNSTAVIIGAMLISPLMGPIIGLGLAVGIHDFELIKRSFRNLLMATMFSVLTSCIYFMVSPVSEAHSELLARTSPTIYDVFIGFFGGAAGILAIGSRVKGNVVPGVAIATALMPPLCTVGYGLATLQPNYIFGALYLFFINSVFIAVATTAGVRLMGYSYKPQADEQRARSVRRLVYTIAVVTMIPAVYMTYSMYRENNFINDCQRFVREEFKFASTQVVNSTPSYGGGGRDNTLTVLLMGRPLNQDSLIEVMNGRLVYYGLSGTRLNIIQGVSAINNVNKEDGQRVYAIAQSTIVAQQSTIDSLNNVLSADERFDSASVMVRPEVKVLFPRVEQLSLARMIVADIDSGKVDTVNVALISGSRPISESERTRLARYLQVRLALAGVLVRQVEL